MKKSWGQFFRRVATACMVTIVGSNAWQSAVCYAAAASDSASDPAYADGWQAGDNGGSGFGPWSFAGSFADSTNPDINSTDPHNNLGTAWHLFNTTGPQSGDVDTAGRGVNLAVGETLSVTFDNATESAFFRGFTIRLNTGGGPVLYGGGGGTERVSLFHFDYFDRNLEVAGIGNSGMTIDDTARGAKVEISLTGPESYVLRLTRLDTNASVVHAGAMRNTGAGAIDFIEFQHYMTPRDATGAKATDMYISSMSVRDGVIPEPSGAILAMAAAGGLMGARRRKPS